MQLQVLSVRILSEYMYITAQWSLICGRRRNMHQCLSKYTSLTMNVSWWRMNNGCKTDCSLIVYLDLDSSKGKGGLLDQSSISLVRDRDLNSAAPVKHRQCALLRYPTSIQTQMKLSSAIIVAFTTFIVLSNAAIFPAPRPNGIRNRLQSMLRPNASPINPPANQQSSVNSQMLAHGSKSL